MSSLRFSVMIVLALPTACVGKPGLLGVGDETGEPIERNLCDGSQDLRLAWVHGGGGLIATDFEREVGFYYLYVRGDCRYWVLPYQKPPTIDVFETRTGVLDDAAEAELAELVSYAEWDSIAGYWDEEGASDVTTTFVHDGETVVGCVGGCPGAPPEVMTIGQAGLTKFLELWEAGESLGDAPMRVLAVTRDPDADTTDSVAWTVDLDLAALAVGQDEAWMAGISSLIDDPQTAAALRQFRSENAEELAKFSEFSVLVGPQESYDLYLRDALPFEDEHGLIPGP